jgi:RNA polymerase sigma factor (sigma-70 family)
LPLTAGDIEKLIAGCKKNDRKAQEQLYRTFHGSMSAICMRYTKHQPDAAAVLNNGFLKVFLKIDQYNATRGTFATWIRNIMVHEAIDFLRNRLTFHREQGIPTPEEPAIEGEAIQKINADALLALIRQLPPATQLVFNLFTVDGFSHREIGEMLGINEGTSRWHLSEARKQLKKSIMVLEN